MEILAIIAIVLGPIVGTIIGVSSSLGILQTITTKSVAGQIFLRLL